MKRLNDVANPFRNPAETPGAQPRRGTLHCFLVQRGKAAPVDSQDAQSRSPKRRVNADQTMKRERSDSGGRLRGRGDAAS